MRVALLSVAAVSLPACSGVLAFGKMLGGSGSAGATARAQTVARAAAPAVEADPRALLGLDTAGVIAFLGDPSLIRMDPPATIWQYRAGSCVADVFLYPQGDGGAQSVIYVELRARSDAAVLDPQSQRACLGRIRQVRGRG